MAGSSETPLLLILACCCLTLGFSDVPSFEPNTLYQYHYTLDLILAYFAQSAMPTTKLQIHAVIDTSLLWRNKDQPHEQLVHVQMKHFTVHNNTAPGTKENIAINPEKRSCTEIPVIIHWSSGKVIGLYTTGEDDSQVLDIKRGLVSLFQFQPLSGTHLEKDVSGRCQVTYNMSKDIISKTKDVNSCIGSEFGYESDYKVLGVSWNSTSSGYMLLNGSTFQKVVSEESHNLSSSLRSQLGVHITSRQQLELLFSKPGSPQIQGESVDMVLEQLQEKFHQIEIMSQPQDRPAGNQTLLKRYLKASKKKINKLAFSKVATVQYFRNVVNALRSAKKNDVLLLLKTASSDLVPFFIDAAIAAQSPATLAALSEFLDFSKKKQVQLQEKFLYSAAFTPHPTADLLNLVLEKLKGKISDPTIMETGIIITGAVVGRLCRMDLCEDKDVEFAKATLLEGLNNAEDETEMKIYLLSLKNAQLPETIPILLQYAEEHTGAVSSTALSALQAFPAEVLSIEVVKDTLKQILHQTHKEYDKKSQLMAAETLLSTDVSMVDLNSISAALDLMDNETSNLLLSKLHHKLGPRHQLMKTMKIPFKNDYWRMLRPGRSTVFSGLLSATNDTGSTYGLDLLFTETGLLKRSISDITLYNDNHQLKAMQVSIEAQGLESLMGNEEADNEEEDAMVGMSAVLLGIQLRPVVFFSGYMDLVTKVFSSTGDPINVVRGNILLVDYLQWLPLQSGLQAIVRYQGALGLEISSKIDVSIWDQQAKSNINAKAGLLLDFTTEMDTSFFHISVKAEADAETSINLDSIMQFTGFPMQMCLELRQDNMPYRETYILAETFAASNTTRTVRKRRTSILWGREFPFHNANSEMCRTMKDAEDISTVL
ncbi:microsomal triglyceride transfer protein-like [Bufo bufo]|uniref:microsomal triglyceride transfer protein-like n=1 Tax=Bufo bufo TaxID=8384 RepID=UPI001ABE1368|nr:microsomal triglyceride transfer protein-like [Bufo bufo]